MHGMQKEYVRHKLKYSRYRKWVVIYQVYPKISLRYELIGQINEMNHDYPTSTDFR
jgi:hypothetical protein